MHTKSTLYAILAIMLAGPCSCASILNAPYTDVTIHTNKQSIIVFQDDTFHLKSFPKVILVQRSALPLEITAISDTVTKKVTISPFNSFNYWANLYFYGIGMLIDRDNPKRYTYPHNIYLDMAKNDSSYQTYTPIASKEKYKNIIKFSPFKTIGTLTPAIELSYERKTGQKFSTQLMASYLLPNSPLYDGYVHNPQNKGYRLDLEERYYFDKEALWGKYIAVEFNYLQKRYRDSVQYERPSYDYTKEEQNFDDYHYRALTRINKQTLNISVNYGVQYHSKHFIFDWYIGIGVCAKDVRYLNRPNQTDKSESPYSGPDLNIYYNVNKEGQYATFILPMNIKIGYAF